LIFLETEISLFGLRTPKTKEVPFVSPIWGERPGIPGRDSPDLRYTHMKFLPVAQNQISFAFFSAIGMGRASQAVAQGFQGG
jgi:hypothetical protein